MKRVLLSTVLALSALALCVAPLAARAESPTPTLYGASASPAAAPSAASGEVVYKIGTTQDYDGFNPFSSWSSITWDAFRLSYDFLTWYDEDYKPTPDLATSWKTSDDGKVWTFTIRSGMKWSDGQPLTARDIAFTYNRIIMAPDYAWAYSQYFVGVTKVEAPDDTTVVITSKRPNAGMLALYVPILPEHIWKDVPDEKLESFRNLPMVGSGPFKLTEAKKGKWVRLEPNPDYPTELGGPPKIDALYYIISTNMDSMVEDYKARNLDAIVDWPASYYQSLAGLPGGAAAKAPAIGFHELAFNCWNDPKSKGDPLLRDVAIRQAVNYAIDKQSIVDAAMGGLAIPGTSLLSPVQGEWHWDVPQDQQYTYDPEKAKQILEDAGYSDRNGDGVRENAKGDKLEFRFVVLNEYPEDQAAGKKIVSWCRDVGIKLDLDTKDEGAFGDEVYDNANYDMFIWSWGGDIDPGFMLSTFTTAQILNWGDSQYSNPEYDKLYNQQAQAVDPADPNDTSRRKAITDQMQQILYRDSPYVILWYNLNLQAYRTDTWTGYHLVPTGGDGAPFWNMMRTTYQDLTPQVASESNGAGSSTPVLVVVIIVLAVIAGVIVWIVRRPKKAEVE